MKKLSIVLLCAFLFFSFISCEKDKSDEVINNYENFKSTENMGENVIFLFDVDSLEKGETEINLSESGADKDDIEDVISKYTGKYLEVISDSDDIAFTSGKLKSNKTDDKNITINIDDAKLDVTYRVYNDDGDPVGDEIKLSLVISGDFSLSTSDDTFSTSFKFKVIDKSYDYSYSKTISTEKYTKAAVNGNNVDVRLLNINI